MDMSFVANYIIAALISILIMKFIISILDRHAINFTGFFSYLWRKVRKSK